MEMVLDEEQHDIGSRKSQNHWKRNNPENEI